MQGKRRREKKEEKEVEKEDVEDEETMRRRERRRTRKMRRTALLLQRFTDPFCPSRILVSTEFTSLGLRQEMHYLQLQHAPEMVLDRLHHFAWIKLLTDKCV